MKLYLKKKKPLAMWWVKTVLPDSTSRVEKSRVRETEGRGILEKIKRKMLKPILSLWAFVLLCGCGSEHLADYQTIPNGEWSEDQPIEFSLPKLDSTAQYDVLLSLRNSNDYPFNNLFLLVTLSHHDGYQQVDTLEYRMARPDGSWLGVGAGNLKDNLLEYRRAMTFDQAGHYRLSLAHALRRNGEVQGASSLNGVMELGYQLIKIE